MAIVEESDSDEEVPAPATKSPAAAKASLKASPKTTPDGYRKVAIGEDADEAPPVHAPPKKPAQPAFAPPPRVPAGVELTPEGVEAAKAKGNAFFQQGNFDQAIQWFSDALAVATQLELRDMQGVLYSNRALVHSKLRDWAAVETDCTSAIELGGKTTVKAQYRRAQARMELSQLTGALQDVNAVIASYGEATNKDAEDLKRRVMAAMADKKAELKKQQLEATVVARRGAPAVPATKPRTAMDVQRNFSALKRHPDQLAEYVRLRVDPATVRSVFKRSMIEADLLEPFLQVITRGDLPAETCREYFDAFLATASGETQLAMLSDAERSAVCSACAGAAPRSSDARLKKLGLL
jgi:tetratricopeptide (TPR) repeat protein